ncbi:MAG: metal ABC transporter substrate-binding protein [Pseudomonadota bacterium]
MLPKWLIVKNGAGKSVVACLLIALAVTGLASCSRADSPDGDAKPKVVTTFTIIADITRNIAGDHIDVVSITKPGAEIHGYEPTPQDLVRAANADLILRNGMNLELWFEQFLGNLGDIPSFTVSEGILPIPIASGAYEGKANPHAWMGTDDVGIYIDNIAATLADLDPDNAETFAANASAYKDKINRAVAPLKEAIDALPANRRWLVSCEGAFAYLARDMGLKELYIWPMNADEVATPQQIRNVIDIVREHEIPAVFCESTVNNAPAEQVVRETDAIFGGVLYVDSLSGPDGPVPTYLDLLEVTTATIARGLKPASN